MTVVADVSTVLETLQSPALAVSEVLQSPELLPAAPGFYGWWSRRGAVGPVPHIPHPLDEEVSLLYVGISPARETPSRAVLFSRSAFVIAMFGMLLIHSSAGGLPEAATCGRR